MTDVAERFGMLAGDTPAARRARWVLHHTLARGLELRDDEVLEAHGGTLPDDFELDRYREDYRWVADQLGDGFTVADVDASAGHEVCALMVSQSGRRWEWLVAVDPEPPHGIRDRRLLRALPEGVAVRVARPEDGPDLRDVARGAPLQLGEVSVSIDPGDDYFASCRLMGDKSVTFVATYNGRPIGVHCAVLYPVRADGNVGRFGLVAHSRLLPEFTGGGIWSRLNDSVFGHFDGEQNMLSGIAYVRPENAAAQRLGGADARWKTRPFRAVLDCAATAGPSEGRPATPDDAGHIVELLNACHGEEELFLPYTVETLTERLERAPDLYTWSDILVGESAVAGVWAAGEVRTFTRPGEEPVVSTRAVALDYGFRAGATDELEALLRAWCARLVPLGITHLGVFSSPASPGADVLQSLAADIEEYDICPPGLEETPRASASGIYVDPVYF